jgi:RHS repeat-associated protein
VGLNRLLKELTYDDGAPSTASRLDGRLHTATRHNWVNLPWDGTNADVDVEVTESYAYDGVGGRVSSRTTDLVRPSPYGTSTFTQSFTWTPLGDRDVMTYPTCSGVACPKGEPGLPLDHGYEAGYLTSIVSPPDVNWIEEIRYHPNGLWSQIDHRNNWTERQTIASHGMQRPLALSAENAAGQQQYTTGSFAYDGAGNVKAMGADSFHYDAHNRLAGGTIDGQGYGYTYDAYGNLTSHTRAGTTVSICIDSRKNRMEEPGSSCPYLEAHQSYFGNIETLQTTNYVYDALDMPIHRNPEPVPPDHTYVYTADEERLWFINAGGGPPPGDGGSGTAWEGLFLRDLDGKLLRQYSKETTTPFTPPDSVYTAPFTVSRDSIHRNGQLAVVRLPGGVIRHQHLDHLGTPRAISAGNGALVSTHKYTPYGKELGGSSGNALQFTGHERDSHGAGEDDNLDYMHARFYSPYVGRFLSVDPRMRYRSSRRPQEWNQYGYGRGNPLKFVDPDGEAAVGFTGGFGQNPGSAINQIIQAIDGAPGIGEARAFSAQQREEALSFLLARQRAEPENATVLVGHSLGANSALAVAADLGAEGVAVDFVVTVDPVFGDKTVPSNVGRAYNYLQTAQALGGNVLTAAISSTLVDNSEIQGVDHTELDEAVAGAVAIQIQQVGNERLELERLGLRPGLQFINGDLYYVRVP